MYDIVQLNIMLPHQTSEKIKLQNSDVLLIKNKLLILNY